MYPQILKDAKNEECIWKELEDVQDAYDLVGNLNTLKSVTLINAHWIE